MCPNNISIKTKLADQFDHNFQALDESQLDLVEIFFSFGGKQPANASTYESVLLAAASTRDLNFAERPFRGEHPGHVYSLYRFWDAFQQLHKNQVIYQAVVWTLKAMFPILGGG